MKKAVLFDNDGVLVDTEHLYFKTTKDVLKEAGVELTEEMFIEYFLRQGKGAWHLLAEKGIAQSRIEELRARRNRAYYVECERQNTLIPGVREVLASLVNRYLLAIVTSCRRDHFHAIHNNTKILDFFHFFLVREDYGKSKPDPEPYLTAWRKTGCDKTECIVIEDSERGLLAAASAGLDCVVIPRGFTRGGRFDGAAAVLNDISALPDYLSVSCVG